MPVILHDRLPIAPWLEEKTRRLPGIQPVAPGDWIRVDEAYGGQMAERDRLLRETPQTVHALSDPARPAAAELLDRLLLEVAAIPGFSVGPNAVTRPDGVEVAIDRDAPLVTAGRLVQEDLCLLENPEGGEHVLTGAVLCFPASWTLTEKFGRSLTSIHIPVARYDEDLARRVQRLFDAVRPEQPLWRANALLYSAPDLYHPRPENAPRMPPAAQAEAYVRSERQCLVRLPVSRAVVFSIHTYVIRRSELSDEQEAGLKDHPFHRFSA